MNWSHTYRGKYISGWPAPMLASVVTARHDSHGQTLAGWDLPLAEMVRRGIPTNRFPAFVRARPERRVPVSPLWGGVAMNITFWSMMCGACWIGVRQTVRTARCRRMRCIACGYDRTGLAPGAVCPECGSATA